MKIVFRADASVEIGTGHVMRCLSLGDELIRNGSEISFLSRFMPESLIRLAKEKKIIVHIVNDAASEAETLKKIGGTNLVDWLIVDHYGIDSKWEAEMASFVKKIFVIDDLANRPHHCDLLLDQNCSDKMNARYDGLVSEEVVKLLGPRYCLLRKQFGEKRATRRTRDGRMNRILVSFGGTDPENATAIAVKALSYIQRNLQVTVLVGASNPRIQEIRDLTMSLSGGEFLCQVEDVAELMDIVDLSIGAGGTTTWERCCLGLPTLAVILAENQRAAVEELDRLGAIKNLGWIGNVEQNTYLEAIESLTSEKLIEMSQKSLDLVDGLGCKRVADILLKGA